MNCSRLSLRNLMRRLIGGRVSFGVVWSIGCARALSVPILCRGFPPLQSHGVVSEIVRVWSRPGRGLQMPIATQSGRNFGFRSASRRGQGLGAILAVTVLVWGASAVRAATPPPLRVAHAAVASDNAQAS